MGRPSSRRRYSRRQYSTRRKISRKKKSRKKEIRKRNTKKRNIRGGAPLDTTFDEDENAAQDIIQGQDEQLRRAAEIGQSLALRAAELEKSNELLTEQRDHAASSLDDHQYRLKELQGESATLHQLVLAKEETITRLEAELEESSRANLGDASTLGTPAGAEDESPLDQSIRGAQSEELSRLKEDTQALQEKEAALQAKIEEDATERLAAERRSKQMSDQLASMQAEMGQQVAAKQAALLEKEGLKAEAALERQRSSELTVRLAAAESKVTNLERLLDTPYDLTGQGLGLVSNLEDTGSASAHADITSLNSQLLELQEENARIKVTATNRRSSNPDPAANQEKIVSLQDIAFRSKGDIEAMQNDIDKLNRLVVKVQMPLIAGNPIIAA